MRRRDVLRTSGGAAVAAMASGLPALPGCAGRPPAASPPNKRQLVLDLLDSARDSSYIPAGFFNILHVCDYHLPYDALTPFLEYPGDVVNCSLHVGEETITPKEASELFDVRSWAASTARASS